MTGKGSSPRPFSVDQQTFNSNWDKIFTKKTDSEQDWYLIAINPWYKMYWNAKTKEHKQIPLEKG